MYKAAQYKYFNDLADELAVLEARLSKEYDELPKEHHAEARQTVGKLAYEVGVAIDELRRYADDNFFEPPTT